MMPTITTADHYVDERLAARSLGVSAATVREKMANGEIAIGPPEVPTGAKLVTRDAGGGPAWAW